MDRDGSDENGDRWCARAFKLADAILDLPSEGPMAFIYKLMVYAFEGARQIDDGEHGGKLRAKARALVEGRA